jgi:hypothetical protein
MTLMLGVPLFRARVEASVREAREVRRRGKFTVPHRSNLQPAVAGFLPPRLLYLSSDHKLFCSSKCGKSVLLLPHRILSALTLDLSRVCVGIPRLILEALSSADAGSSRLSFLVGLKD